MSAKAKEQARDGLTFMVRSEAMVPSSINEDERSIEAVIATDTPTLVFDWERGQIIDEVLRMDGVELPRQIKFLDSHSRWSTSSVIGSTRDFRVDGGKLIGRNYFSSRADDQWEKTREGHLTDNSIGYRVLEYTHVPLGESVVVGGKKYNAGARNLRVVTKWELRENSLVVFGADAEAKMRMESDMKTATDANKANTPETTGTADNTRTVTATSGTGADSNSTNAAETVDVSSVRAATAAAIAEEMKRQREAENARVSAIRELGEGLDEKVVEEAIRSGETVEAAGKRFLASIKENRRGPVDAPFVNTGSGEATMDVLRTAVALRIGADPIRAAGASESKRKAAEELCERADPLRDAPILDMLRHAFNASRISAPLSRHEFIRSAFSTGTLANLMTTSMNMRVMQAYQEAEDSTTGMAVEQEIANYLTAERVQPTKLKNLELTPAGATAPHNTLGDVAESYKLARYASQIVFDEIDLANDNTGNLMQSGAMLGAAARRLRPDLFVSILLANATLAADSTALFASGHSNLVSGSGTAMSAASLKTALTAMRKQKQGDATLNLSPAFLYVPPELEFLASQLMGSVEVRSTGDATATEFGTMNPLRGRAQVRTEARLANGVVDPRDGTIRSGSTTAWFLFASPSVAPTIEIGYLVGTSRGPRVEQFTLTEGKFGIGWSVQMSIGGAALDFRGVYKSAGA